MFFSRAVSTDPKVALLRSVPGLAGAGAREICSLASLFDEAVVEEGALLAREGEPGRELFLIVEGEVLVTLRGDALATVGPGEFVGEMTLFERAPRAATLTALTPTRVLVAGSGSFGALLNEPAVLRRLAATLANRLRASQGSPTSWAERVGPEAAALR
jgi:CRP/FNR family cyclic AMP-dependent transcriptional regulator